ncbi:MAG: sulfatase-like hydrolase/transferase [Salinivirgaceae bacterium]|nr:sulfatase-like hydrolase/transferase [Salinivirgaceae bacterium]
MKNKLFVFLRIWILWLLFFSVSRLYFIVYNITTLKTLSFSEILLTFVHGFQLDLSMSGYILFFIAILFALLFFLNGKGLAKILKPFQIILLTLFIIVFVADAELYRNWGFRMDNTILLYIKTPKEAMASTPIWMTLILVIISVFFFWFFTRIFKRWVFKPLIKIKSRNWYVLPVFLLIAGLMIIPIRGGLGIAPINVGTVYFSNNQLANHTAINVHWNFGKSLTIKNANEKVQLLSKEETKNKFSKLMRVEPDSLIKVLNTEKPNIIIVVLESFTANIIEVLGGREGVTPNFNKLSKEGVLFSNCYASGDRSDKGLVSILSAYPAQPTTSIIKFTGKAAKLPHLSKKLHELNYSSAFYYGGEINFANLNSYFLSGEYQELITLDDFSRSDLNSKWGAHDHVVFDRFIKGIAASKEPFFRVMFSLSSHEPFEVPHKSQFSENDEVAKFLNAAHYTDSCIGDFVSKAKKSDWWDHSLIIFVADHGVRNPGNLPNFVPKKFHIPMLWLGGALNIGDTVIKKTVSQVDIPKMLGNQIGFNTKDFIFSKDVFQSDKDFALYAFKNGFGFISDSSKFVYDISGSKDLINENATLKDIENGKAYLQTLLNDYKGK